jgi:HEPN domain-containing protein
MSDADRTAAFLALAGEDLEAARLLKFGVPRQAAFFVQQAAEKIGKALLIREGVDPRESTPSAGSPQSCRRPIR